MSDVRTSKGITRNDKLLAVSKLALDDAEKVVQLAPSDPSGYLAFSIARLGVTLSSTGRLADAKSEAILTHLLETDGLDPEFRSEAYRFRGQARGFDDAVLADMNEAIRLTPYEWRAYQHRANYWQGKDDAKADADIRRMRELHQAELDAHCAFGLATAADPAQRDAAAAVRFGKQACEATNYEYWRWDGALAAAYAEAGNFDRAVALETKVLGLVPSMHA